MKLPELARAGAIPVASAIVLLGLLATWVGLGGAGTLSRVQISVTRAAIPMPSFNASGISPHRAPMFLTVSNLTGTDDVLVSAGSPAARRVIIAGGRSLAIPAHSTVSLSPFGPDLVLIDPKGLVTGRQVRLRLRFSHAGTVLIEADVTAPGVP